MEKMKKLPRKPKYTNLQLHLMKQEKEGREKQHKKMVKQLEKYEKKQTCPMPVSMKKKSPIPKKLELTKAQKALHKKVFGKKKTVYVSPVKSPKTTKKPTKKSPKSKTSPVKSAKSNRNSNNNNSTSSVSNESIRSAISNKSMNYGSN
jgi:hypothetical protein